MTLNNTIPAKEGGKLHGNDGNQHAKKANPKSEIIAIRCTKEQKKQIRKNADKAKLSMSDYIVSVAVNSPLEP